MQTVNDVALDLGIVSLSIMTLWLYLPGFLANTFAMMWGKWLPKTGYGPWPIDGGKNWKDGNRILGDGKTWNGLIGGSITSGILCAVIVAFMGDVPDESTVGASIFAHPLTGYEGTWFDISSPHFSAFILGTFLGFACLIGDSTGSFFLSEEEGSKEKGDISSKAPLFGHITIRHHGVFMGQLFLGDSLLSQSELVVPMIIMIIITPILHRSFNLIGYYIGWKDVPY